MQQKRTLDVVLAQHKLRRRSAGKSVMYCWELQHWTFFRISEVLPTFL